MNDSTPVIGHGRLVWVVGFVAAGLLGFEIALMRLLLVASYHHFAFLVITAALLGFGASGSALFLLRTRVLRYAEFVLPILTVLTSVSIPLTFSIAQWIPVEPSFLATNVLGQIPWWILYWSLMTVPFFLGSAVLGLALMVAGRAVASVYASNLIGSAAGALGAPLAMLAVPPAWLPVFMGSIVLAGALGVCRFRIRKDMGVLACGAVMLTIAFVRPPTIRIDQFKDLAYLERLRRQGSATLLAESYGPRAAVAAYQSDALHDLLFLGLGENPPPMSTVVLDGQRAGSVLEVGTTEEAAVVDHMLMAFPYDLLPPLPTVLLLGEIGGSNIWLAARYNAQRIDVVQPLAEVFDLLRGPLAKRGGAVLALPAVHPIVAYPRHFIDHTSEHYDLIQLVTLEGTAVGGSGLGGLGEDYLMTVEGVHACLSKLTDGGLLAVTRGIQTPPRDNLKILATVVSALSEFGVSRPLQNIVVIRDFLGVCTVARKRPWGDAEIDKLRDVLRRRELTPVWFPGVEPAELNQPDELPAAPDGIGDWYNYTARRLGNGTTSMGKLRGTDAKRFLASYPFSIDPATDDRPFFHDFCKLTSIGTLRRALGDTWITRVELGFLFVLLAIAIAVVVGAMLTIGPLLLTGRNEPVESGRGPTLLYFAAIGLAYMIIEIVSLARVTLWVGDPVVAAAVTIGGFLVLSGFGSLTAARLRASPGAIRWGASALVGVGLLQLAILPTLSTHLVSTSLAGRCGLALLAIAPLAYLMGFPMPLALRRLQRARPALLPWAWGVNGFASVLGAPLATAAGMTWGFFSAGLGGCLLYSVAGVVFARLPDSSRES